MIFGSFPLEADLPFRKPCELDSSSVHILLAGGVDGSPGGINRSLPALVGIAAVDLELLAYAFHHLEVYIVQCSSAGDKVLGRLLMAHAHLEPLIAAQMIGDPALAALVLA